MTVVIGHLFPDVLDTYGDAGNVMTLRRRLEWRGLRVQVVPIGTRRSVEWPDVDIVVGGGGPAAGLHRLALELAEGAAALRQAVAAGLPLLAVGTLYRAFGDTVMTAGRELPGVGIFAAVTRETGRRQVGNLVLDSPFGPLVGFENHQDTTSLAPGQQPLGTLRSQGAIGPPRHDGAISHCAVGTNLHGPVLPNNPALADHLIRCLLRRRLLADDLAVVDNGPMSPIRARWHNVGDQERKTSRPGRWRSRHRSGRTVS